MKPTTKEMLRYVHVCVVAYACLEAPFAVAGSTEQLATAIAGKHNANPARLNDEMTVSSTARAVGTRVVITNVMRLKPNITIPEKLEFERQLKLQLRAEMCATARQVFKAGITYDLVFTSTYEQLVAAFPVAERDCQ